MPIDLTNILGTYTPLINTDGTYVIGIAGLDWAWIMKAVMMLIGMWFMFKWFYSLARRDKR